MANSPTVVVGRMFTLSSFVCVVTGIARLHKTRVGMASGEETIVFCCCESGGGGGAISNNFEGGGGGGGSGGGGGGGVFEDIDRKSVV